VHHHFHLPPCLREYIAKVAILSSITSITRDQPQEGNARSSEANTTDTIESAIEKAKRAFALRKYEQAVEHYATALELV
jgi:hypothetical protein